MHGGNTNQVKEASAVCLWLREWLKNQKFDKPIITPTTKAVHGHDEDISKEEIIAQGLVSKEHYEKLEDYTMELFQRGSEYAEKMGLILVDTKYEFGLYNDEIILIDEVHTPDSSRYFIAKDYETKFAKGEKQKQLSKEFIREWLMENGFQGKEGQQLPEITDEVVENVMNRYIELYETVTGETFERSDRENLNKRIEDNMNKLLK
jgi:phosphoribosylaminoimidazole-succinocarboxamide synthase